MNDPVAPNTNDLGTVITDPKIRTYIYGAYVVILVLAGATTVGYATVASGLPTWLEVANQVLGYLGIPVGTLAIANIPKGS